ncbi:MAG: right-handed parallel beta-helix repeat-containing protein [Planctomycetota bacterium]|nr:right-handed parallel beta-helix repeat-containing protein [Planctomycetota bacterium]
MALGRCVAPIAFVALSLSSFCRAVETRRVPQEFATIGEAVAAAATGDTILVGAGEYRENVVTGAAGLRFVGQRAVWDGTIGGVPGTCLTCNGALVTVQGFTFRNGTDLLVLNGPGSVASRCRFENASDDGVQINADDVTVSKCSFFGISDTTILVINNRARVLIDRNRLFNCGDEGIDVSGPGARILFNYIHTVDDNDAIRLNGGGGTDAVIMGNRIFNAADEGIEVSSSPGVLVARNTILHAGGEGIFINGVDGARVERNRIEGSGSHAIRLIGDDFSITSNVVRFTIDDADGCNVANALSGGGGLFERNTILGATAFGCQLAADAAIIRNNRVSFCGSEDQAGFLIAGDNNTLERNRATRCDADGFRINGDFNTLAGDVASACSVDGFDVETGTGNRLTTVRAMDCGGEGFENNAAATEVAGATFLRNRIDVANNGTVAAFDNVRFETGGLGTAPEIE